MADVLLTADWVVPVSRRPIRYGAVLVTGEHIASVGAADILVDQCRASDVIDLSGCILMPGLVNAHTHLGLTALAGVLPPEPFTQWLPRLVAAMRSWGPEDYAASSSVGARRCIEAGVTVVGDVVYGASSVQAARDQGLGGAFFFEVLGIGPGDLPGRLEELGFSKDTDCGARARCGLSPHTLYSSSPALLGAVVGLAREADAPVMMHVAETAAEIDLLRDGSGPLAGVAQRLAAGFRPTGERPIAYLDRLGVLDAVTAVHLCQTWPSDVGRMASTARGVVTCPRSNEWLDNGIAPVERLLEAGLPVGIGTDSLASSPDLDLFAEVRALGERFPRLDARTLIEMATAHGALALGVEDRFGVLEPGMQADVVAFRLPEAEDPETALVRRAACSNLDAAMVGGEWRVRDGRFLADTTGAEARVTSAATRAREAVQG